jgi:hypothetical protein
VSKQAALLALFFSPVGTKDQAFEWLEKAYEGRDFVPLRRTHLRQNGREAQTSWFNRSNAVPVKRVLESRIRWRKRESY